MAIGDWASWAQVAVIAATGSAAVIVANVQLNAFNRNERLRNSIKIIDRMMAKNALQDVDVSPFDAGVTLGTIAKDPDKTSLYQQLSSEIEAFQRATADDKQWFLRTRSKAPIVASYLIDLASFLDLNMLDRRFVMPKISIVAPQNVSALLALGYDSGPHMRRLRWLNDECAKCRAKSES